MPIPPRSIPQHRPGTSVPRKPTPLYTDWRTELALLGDYPKSLPSSTSTKGVTLIDKSQAQAGTLSPSKAGYHPVIGVGAREVQLEQLIEDGKGKREKRASMAVTLGFDMIPNPVIIPLPDCDSDSFPPTAPKPSLLSASKSIPIIKGGRVSPALSTTPTTPALLPQQEEDEDDWEYIPSERDEVARADRGREEEDEDGDIIVLGEMELEDVVVQEVESKVKTVPISYADIVARKI